MSVNVSVIMPVFNASKYLNDAIKSVLMQTLNNIELVCVNDGSTDNSWDIIQEYASKDSRIKAYSQKNKGRSASRNKALDVAQGEFVFFLDSDDFLPNKESLEKLYNAARSYNVEICRGNIALLNKNTVKPNRIITQTDWADFIKEGIHYTNIESCLFGWTAYLYKREFLIRNCIRLNERDFFEDPLFLTEVLCCADIFCHVDIDAYCIRGGTHGYSYGTEIVEQLTEAIYFIINKAIECKKLNIVENCLFSILHTSYYGFICRAVKEDNTFVIDYLQKINRLILKLPIEHSHIFEKSNITDEINKAQLYKEELNSCFNRYDNILLYGAGINGRKLKNLLKRDFNLVPTGFAVTEQKEEILYVDELVCKKITDWQLPLNTTLIIISVAEKLRKEIELTLNELGYNHIYFDRTRWLTLHDDDMSIYDEKRSLNGRDD